MRRKVIEKTDGYIAKGGKTTYSICVAAPNDCAMQYAAEELKRLIKLASDAELSIGNGSAESAIYLSVGKGLSAGEKNRNGFTIKTVGKDVHIDGVDKTGLLFGVYRFMELVADYMYLADDETLIGDCVAFKKLDVYDYPDFQNRDVYNYDTKHFADHARRLYLSGGNFSIEEEKYGEGSWWSTLWDQSLCDQLVDHKVYRNKYPHWYSSPDKAAFQLCYTIPKLCIPKTRTKRGISPRKTMRTGITDSFGLSSIL